MRNVTAPTPAECRAFFEARIDASLGLVPQRWLSPADADLWSRFWFAARVVDDEIEGRITTADEWRRQVVKGSEETAAVASFEAFVRGLPAHIPVAWVRSQADDALRAMGEERAATGPPSRARYLERVTAKAGFPLAVLNRLIMPHERPAAVDRFARELAISIQLGDDARDRRRDAALGLWTLTEEELGVSRPSVPPAAWSPAILAGRLVWAREHAQRAAALVKGFSPAAQPLAQEQVQMWLASMEEAARAPDQPIAWPIA